MMYNYAPGSMSLTFQMNSNKKPLGPDGNKENINDEEQLDRILTKSEKLVYIGGSEDGKPVAGKQVIIQEMKYDNPYLLLVIKIVARDTADTIKKYEEKIWNEEIKDYARYNSEGPRIFNYSNNDNISKPTVSDTPERI